MRDWWEHWYNRYAVVALTTAVAIAGYEGIHWACLSASDWGTWIGAIGTVGTLIGTSILATNESRRRHREELALARITAGQMLDSLDRVTLEVSQARDEARRILMCLRQGSVGQKQAQLDALLCRLSEIETVPREELRDLLPVGEKFPMMIAGVQGGIISSVGLIKAASKSDAYADWNTALRSVIDRLDGDVRILEAVRNDLTTVVFRSPGIRRRER